MPTGRFYSFVGAAVILYLFANQTQVGWLYAVAALLLATALAAWPLNRDALKGLQAERRISGTDGDLYEGETAEITLTIRNTARGDRSLIRLAENCPLVAPDDAQRETRLFIPVLPGGTAAEFRYPVTLYRRGLHTFQPIMLESGAPFGFFQRAGTLDQPTRVLVYPEVRRLNGFELLDRRLAAQVSRPRAGVGYEALGVRPYRVGDSPRHIHWRSVARTGQLISKEFADEAQPGLTLALDLFAHPYPAANHKHTPFEWAVKAAASIGEYARRRGYTLHLLVDGEALPAPTGAVAWDALLQYLARVQPTGKRRLEDVLRAGATQPFVAIILPWPDTSILTALAELRARQAEILSVIIDPATFPEKGIAAGGLAGQLRAQGVETRVVLFGEDWAGQLE